MLIYLVEYNHDCNDVDCSLAHCEVIAACGTRDLAVAAVRTDQSRPKPDWDKSVAPLEGDADWFNGCDQFYAIREIEVQLGEIADEVAKAKPDIVVEDGGRAMDTLHRLGAVTDREWLIDRLRRAGVTAAEIEAEIVRRERANS